MIPEFGILNDVDEGKYEEEVLEQAISIIDNYESKLDYKYEKPNKELFYS